MTNESLAQRHEREFAEVIPGGETVIGSGSKLEKHDVSTSRYNGAWQFRYELKCTQQKGYRLTYKDWRDLVEYVYQNSSDMRPAWGIRYYNEDEKKLADLVVVDLNDWVELLDELTELREQLGK